MRKVKDWIVDRWLTWRTGKDAQTRAWDKWREETIVYRAGTVENYFMNFKYILPLDYRKVYPMERFHPFFGDRVDDGFDQYLYPNKPLGDNTVIHLFRGYKDSGFFHITDFGDTDQLYAATNNERDAMMIALKYGG